MQGFGEKLSNTVAAVMRVAYEKHPQEAVNDAVLAALAEKR